MGWGDRESTPNGTLEQPLQNASLRARRASQRARSSSSTMATLRFFFCFFSSAFFVSAPFSSQSLPHSHSPAQFQANPKSSPNASHTSPEYIPNQKQTAVDNVPSLRDKVITHTGTRARNDTIRSSAMHFNKHQDIQAAAIQNATQIETGTVLHRLQGQLLHCPSFCTPQRNTYLAFNQQ